MSVEENIRTFEAVTKALNAHDLDRFENAHLESVIQRDPAHAEPLKGRRAVREGLEPFVKAFPDLRMSADRIFGSGDWISVQGSFQGTHRASLEVPGQTIPATNKAIRIPYAVIAKLEGGKFAEVNVYYDQMAMMAQLGLLPPEAPE